MVNVKKRSMYYDRVIAICAITALLGGMPHFAKADRPVGLHVTDTQNPSVSISGTVVDEKGEVVIGASVLEKGTGNGTITDIDGRFTLNVKSGAKLVISYVGYRTQEVTASASMRIVLQEDTELLDEVVVVGYGTQKKVNLTGAVASVDVGKALGARPIADVGRGLQGTTPGLSVVVPNGEVGIDPRIKIRGQIGSFEGSSAPLILVDNVEVPSISFINPDDIESISVLKDAASASIYGAKGAFGVVLITTKRGAKQESLNIAYSGNFAWQNPALKMEMAGLEGMEYNMIAALNGGKTVSGWPYYVTPEGLERMKEWQKEYGGKLGVDDPTVYGRDWYVDAQGRKIGLRTYDPYDYMVREWAPSTNHNLSLNGRSGKIGYNVGLGYLNQNGMTKPAKHDDFKRYNASTNLDIEVSKVISVNAGMIFSKQEKRFPYVTGTKSEDPEGRKSADPWYYMYRWGPTVPFGRDDRGYLMRGPEQQIHDANTGLQMNNYFSVNLGTHINIMKNWTADLQYTYANRETIFEQNGTRFSAADTWGAPIKRLDKNGNQVYVNGKGDVIDAGAVGAMPAYDLNYVTYTGAGSTPDLVYREAKTWHQNTFNAYTTYNLNLDDTHHFKFMAGVNQVSSRFVSNWSQKKELSNIHNPQFDLATGEEKAGGDRGWESQLGYYGRINYDFLGRYLFEANLRYDGTSKFPTDLKWRWFPSFSAGWRVSEEAWMEWSKPFLASLKIRGSWGQIGDQTVANTLYLSLMESGQGSWLDASGKKLTYVGIPSSVLASITWQDIESLNLGFDVSLIEGKLDVMFDWYRRDTKNTIVPMEGVPATFGSKAPLGNFGNLRTYGWELSVNYRHQFKNGLGVNAMVTLSDALTEITQYGSSRSIEANYNGKTYGEIWGYRTDRLYQKDDFVYDAKGELVKTYALNGKEVAKGTAGAKLVNKLKDPNGVYQDYLQSGNFIFGPGDVKFKDVNGDGKIDQGASDIHDHGDKEKIGNTTPRFEYGIRLGADYKGFDFSIFMQGVGKRELWGSSSISIPGFNTSDGAMAKSFAKDYWTEENTGAFYPRPWNMANSKDAYNMRPQDKYLLNMAYLRVKNITFGYTLPEALAGKAYMKSARVYASLENFFTFDHLRGLPLDPEVIPGATSFYEKGNAERVGLSVPTFKSISFGVQLTF